MSEIQKTEKPKKDPAFLFYSSDFYTGTRLMLPEERACYLDLLIYQHQNNGYIPLELNRVLMFCTGVSLATLKATLEDKFIKTPKGYYNSKLESVINTRGNYKNMQSSYGKIGFYFKNMKKLMPIREFLKYEKILKNLDTAALLTVFKKLNFTNKDTLKTTLKTTLKHLENENEDENENINENKNEVEVNKKNDEKLIFPFDSEIFKNTWQLWKDFKNKEFAFKYASSISEQAALKKIANLSNGNEQTAIKIIHQSLENGWKGLFELNQNNTKNNQNGSALNKTNEQIFTESMGSEIASNIKFK